LRSLRAAAALVLLCHGIGAHAQWSSRATATLRAPATVASQPAAVQAPAPMAGTAPTQSTPALKSATALSAVQQPQERLAEARQLHSKHQLTFPLAMTDALKYPLAQVTGARGVEAAWRGARAQNARAAPALLQEKQVLARPPPSRTLQGGVVRAAPHLLRSADAPRLDWRDFDVVSAVGNQNPCGSCWAFAAAAAFESSYRLRNGVLVNISEQELLDCTPASCNGGNSGAVFTKATTGDGLYVSNDHAPYMAAKGAQCVHRQGARPLRAVAWGFVDDVNPIPSNARLKQALVEHGPLAVTLFAYNLFQGYLVPDGTAPGRDVFTYGVGIGDGFNGPFPDANGNPRRTYFQVDKHGVLRGTARGEILSDVDAMTREWLASNHVVTLIGWDDTRQAWLIKNSWGTNWGTRAGGREAGYGWVSYGQANIGAYAMWVRAGLDLKGSGLLGDKVASVHHAASAPLLRTPGATTQPAAVAAPAPVATTATPPPAAPDWSAVPARR
jgi:cathepsin L